MSLSRERFDKGCEWFILALVLAVLVYAPLATAAVQTQDFLVVEALVLAATAAWVVRFWANPKHRLLWPPACWAVAAFVIYAILSYRHAGVEYVARGELIRILVYALFFFVIVNNLNRQESSQWVSYTLFILAVGIAAYAIYQYTTKSNRVWDYLRPWQYSGRGSGTFIGPNALAGFLGLVLPMALAFTIMGRVAHTTRIAIGYGAVVMMVGIGVSVSRGGIIASALALVVLLVVLVRKPGYRIPAFVLLAVVLGAGIWFLSTAQFSQKRFQGMVVNGKLEDFRFGLWAPAWKMWQEQPWWGRGPAQFDIDFPRYRTEALQVQPEYVHNDYLNTLVDYGVAGMVLMGAVWVLVLWGVGSTWKSVQRTGNGIDVPRSNRTAFALGGAIGLLAILFHSWVDFNLHVPGVALVAIAWLALLTGYWRFATERFWAPASVLVRLAVTIVAVAGIVYLAHTGMVQYQEDALLRTIRAGKTPVKLEIERLKKAYEIEPANPKTPYQLGEAYRRMSFAGNNDYEPLAREAMKWLEIAMRLNPKNPHPPMQYGMCLDWIDEPEQGDAYFAKALALDPNNFVIVAYQGWHLAQKREWAASKAVLERSLRLQSWDNPVAQEYLLLANQRLGESK